MADNIGTITFTNVSLSNGTVTGTFEPTTVTIDYTTGTVTSGTVVFNDGGHHVFTHLQLTEQPAGSSNYVLYEGTIANPAFAVEWSGTSPSAFTAAVVQASIGNDFDTFKSNTVTPGVCFAAGTMIRTPAGDVRVETLKAGDLVLTASGEMRPVKWMGHTDVDFRRTPKGSPGLPIRIAADAFGPDRPSQDLYLSAGHSVCVELLGEVLIPIGYLVNGSTIAEVETDATSYWHVELDSHDILIANNLPAESYLAMANRGSFEELRGLLPTFEEGRERTHADFCRPVVIEGPILDFVRQRLAARAEELGWRALHDADLHLVADGEVLRPRVEGSLAKFEFPASAKDVRLVSNVFSPPLLGAPDPRMLGVMLLDGLAFGDKQISLGHERLRDGVYHLENHGGAPHRWTNGDLILDPQLWEGQTRWVTLTVNYDVTTIRGWTAPPAPKRHATSRPRLYAVG
jgi:Hint domain